MARRFSSPSSSSSSSIRSLARSIIAVVVLVLATTTTTFVSARLGTTLDDSGTVDEVDAALVEQEQRQQQQPVYGRIIDDQFIVQVATSTNLNQLLRVLRNDWMPRRNENDARVLFEYQNAFYGFAVQGLAESVLQAFSEAYPGDILLIEPDYEVQLYQEEEWNHEYDDNDDDFDDDDYYDTEDQQERRRRRKRQRQRNQGLRATNTWGLDRVDQKNLPLDGTFQSTYTGAGVDVYIIDTGVLASHQEFGNRVTQLQDFTADQDGIDYNGHGTHVAGNV
jgi:hypothetical protein